ncbi:hypothetical protein VKT23_011463 [Stygiomarasmius scandens]|uniref:NADP-dependent oxidoreductase domain-containing protein n=1 Tax=Marasmiellus scandens TaxID=2682957 RepID=A0ABR1J8B8_9AGAR
MTSSLEFNKCEWHLFDGTALTAISSMPTCIPGLEIPSIAFGTWRLGNGDSVVQQVIQAAAVGIRHFDTAQAYRNETEVGLALQYIMKETGLKRDEIFITTKWSALKGVGIKDSVEQSLKDLGVSYVDLYLIHHPRLPVPDIPSAWKEMEEVYRNGFAKAIGVSNFDVQDLATLLEVAAVKPAVNQILLHPYIYEQQQPIVKFAQEHGIVIEAYSVLKRVNHHRILLQSH